MVSLNASHSYNTYHIYHTDHTYHTYQIAQTDNVYIPTMPRSWLT